MDLSVIVVIAIPSLRLWMARTDRARTVHGGGLLHRLLSSHWPDRQVPSASPRDDRRIRVQTPKVSNTESQIAPGEALTIIRVTPSCHAATMTCPVPTQTASCCPGRVAAISRYTRKVILALPHYGAPGSPRVRRELLHA